MTLARGTVEQKQMAQDALNRWWWPSVMMFGPHDEDSTHSDQSMRWKIKRFTNDELRLKFINATAPQAEFIDLEIPDKDLKWNKTKKSYEHGPIDWNEFWNVVKGNGPMARDRVAARKQAWDEGEWVRNAALAYSEKHHSEKFAAE